MKIINLLPKSRQEELYYEVILDGVYKVIWISIGTFAMVFLIQLGAKFFLQSQLNSINTSITQLKQQVNKDDNAKLKRQITDVNSVVSDFQNLATGSPRWSNVVEAFVPLVPDGMQITTFNVDSTDTVHINGLSPTRDSVIQLYNNVLADTNDFSGIDYPFENVVNATNVTFHFTFKALPDLLNK